MKTPKKIVAITLACAIPLGVFAYEKFDKENGYKKDRHDKSSYEYRDHHDKSYRDFEDDDMELSHAFLEKLGVNMVFEGNVEKRPKKGFNGVWTISGHEVIVDDKTKLFFEKGINLKDEVEVLAKRENGKIKALFIEED